MQSETVPDFKDFRDDPDFECASLDDSNDDSNMREFKVRLQCTRIGGLQQPRTQSQCLMWEESASTYADIIKNVKRRYGHIIGSFIIQNPSPSNHYVFLYILDKSQQKYKCVKISSSYKTNVY